MKVKNAFITKMVEDSADGDGVNGLVEKRFPNGNLFLKIKNKLRGKKVPDTIKFLEQVKYKANYISESLKGK